MISTPAWSESEGDPCGDVVYVGSNPALLPHKVVFRLLSVFRSSVDEEAGVLGIC